MGPVPVGPDAKRERAELGARAERVDRATDRAVALQDHVIIEDQQDVAACAPHEEIPRAGNSELSVGAEALYPVVGHVPMDVRPHVEVPGAVVEHEDLEVAVGLCHDRHQTSTQRRASLARADQH